MHPEQFDATKDLDTILDLYFEQQDVDTAYNLLTHLIFMECSSREVFDMYVQWFSSLTQEQKVMNIPTCIWNAR